MPTKSTTGSQGDAELTMAMIFGRNLRAAREKAGLTQGELGQASGIDDMSISRYERGKNTPSMESAKVLARALRCTVDDLIRSTAA
jgi:transcriptional regulator with XRE-family HTH domain